jgi:hypothetical protein
MMLVKKVEDAYHFALKEEEKLAIKQSQRGRGKSPAQNKGKGVTHEKAHKSNDEIEKSHISLGKRRKFPRKTWWWKKFL